MHLVVIIEDLIKDAGEETDGDEQRAMSRGLVHPGTEMCSLICKLQIMQCRDFHDGLIKKT